MTDPAKGRGTRAVRPASVRAYWQEHEIDHWIHERVRGLASAEPAEEPAHPRLIPQREVLKRTGLSRVTVWRWEQRGLFPKRVHVGGGEVR